MLPGEVEFKRAIAAEALQKVFDKLPTEALATMYAVMMATAFNGGTDPDRALYTRAYSIACEIAESRIGHDAFDKMADAELAKLG